MTNEEKELLLKDLCARLPYRVFAEVGTTYDFENDLTDLVNIELVNYSEESVWGTENHNMCFWYNLDTYQVKPYLRPMSSMSEEEKNELWFLVSEGRTNIELNSNGQLTTKDNVELGFNYPFVCPQGSSQYVDWLNAHHFDYRGLIPMGLALEAPKDMYDIK